MRGSWNWAIAAEAASDLGPGMDAETMLGRVGSSGKKEAEACVASERRGSAERRARREAMFVVVKMKKRKVEDALLTLSRLVGLR